MPGDGKGRIAAQRSVRHWRRALGPSFVGVWLAMATATTLASGCGSPNPRVIASDDIEARAPERQHSDLSEADKIRALIDEVRASKATFYFTDVPLDAEAAANELQHRVPRMAVATVRQFIENITRPAKENGPTPRVKLEDGTTLDGRDWYIARVEEIEGARREVRSAKLAREAHVPTQVGILDALTIVERSNKRFVAPARTLPNGKTKGKRKEYDATEFAEMLRKKWEFLGADVRDLDTFIGEIASDAFSSMAPYRVIHEDGSEEEFRGWLTAQLDQRRAAMAKGGAP